MVTDKLFMLLQDDSGFDYNCAMPRSIENQQLIMGESVLI